VIEFDAPAGGECINDRRRVVVLEPHHPGIWRAAVAVRAGSTSAIVVDCYIL
jgi:hypothetical protein